jgi:hypothetical protein
MELDDQEKDNSAKVPEQLLKQVRLLRPIIKTIICTYSIQFANCTSEAINARPFLREKIFLLFFETAQVL